MQNKEICAEGGEERKTRKVPQLKPTVGVNRASCGISSEKEKERERVGEQDGRAKMREKEQQRDPAEFMIILLKHTLARVKPWHKRSTHTHTQQRECVCVCVQM